MRYWLIHWLLSAVALPIVAAIVPGITVDGFGAALAAALVIGIATLPHSQLLETQGIRPALNELRADYETVLQARQPHKK